MSRSSERMEVADLSTEIMPDVSESDLLPTSECPALTIQDVQRGTSGSLILGPGAGPHDPITGAEDDSRRVRTGNLFMALPGERVDGHDYIDAAIRAGARAVLLSRHTAGPPPGVAYVQVPDTVHALGVLGAYWRSRMSPRVIGITGSVGKTSTKEILAAVLATKYATVRSQGSLNSEIGLPLALLTLRPEHERAVFEMGGAWKMGEIAHLCSLARPVVGVVTNVGHSHMERMGNLECITRNKSELVSSLPPDGLAVLNRDDENVRSMADVAPCRVLWYGMDSEATVRADRVESRGLHGIRFSLSVDGRWIDVESKLLGRHNVHNVLAAAAVAHAEGMTLQSIAAALAAVPAGPRLVTRPGPNGSTLIDDTYNASPVSTIAALDLLANTPGRKIAVLGDMAELGEYAKKGHQKVGVRASEVCDLLYTVGSLGRMIAQSALDRGMDRAAVRQAETVEEITPVLLETLTGGDVVLLKGSRVMELDKLAAVLSRPNTEERC